MKLVNARGMDAALYDMQDSIKASVLPLIRSHCLTTGVSAIQSHPDKFPQYRVSQSNNETTVEVFKKKAWETAFVLVPCPEHDGAINGLFKTSLTHLTLKDPKNKKHSAFIEQLYPNFDKAVEEQTNVMLCFMLNLDEGMQNYNDTFATQLPQLFEYAQQHPDSKNRYNYHKSSFYMKKNKVILSNQNFSYTLSFAKNVYNIKVLLKDPDPTLALNVEFTFDTDENNARRLVIKEFDQPFVLVHFMMDLESAVESYQEDHDIVPPVNPVVKTYAYHLAYMSQNFGLTKEEIIWRMAFYCFPEGTDEQGNYIYNERENLPYQKASEVLMKNIHETIAHKEFTVPVSYENNKIFKKIKHLNDDWKLFFSEAHTLVAQFVEKYKSADAAKRKKLSHIEENELLTDMEGFLTVSAKLIKPAKTAKIK